MEEIDQLLDAATEMGDLDGTVQWKLRSLKPNRDLVGTSIFIEEFANSGTHDFEPSGTRGRGIDETTAEIYGNLKALSLSAVRVAIAW